MGVLLLLAVVLAVGGRLEASSEVSRLGFMDHLMSMNGCGSFAGLVNATANATETFQRSLAHRGLVVFCPDDKAVAAFEPSLFHHSIDADAKLAVLLYHGVELAPASLRDRRRVPTLATDLANGDYGLTIRHGGDKMELSSSSGGVARVTRTVIDKEGRLVVYLIDAVLLPRLHIDYCSDNSCPGPLYSEYVDQATSEFSIVATAILAASIVFIAIMCLGALIYGTLKAVLLLGVLIYDSLKACTTRAPCNARAIHPLPSGV